MKSQSAAVKSYMCLKPFLNGLSLFLGILFLGLISCSTATDSTSSSPTEDKTPDTTPPTVTISTKKSLEIDIPGTISFTFSEKITNFTPGDIQLLINGVNAAKGSFVTNNQKSYSLEITPITNGNLYVGIQANSFEDLSGNQNTDSFSNNFLVKEDKTPPTVTISTSKFLKKDILGTITFIFSERVKGFTKSDIQFLPTGVSNVEKGNFVANNLTNYSLEITPKLAGTLEVSILDNSFEDLSGNQNTDSFSTNFSVEDKTPPTVNISSDTLIEGTSAFLSFTFSEKVNNFTPSDIQFLTNEANGVNAAKGNFVTNSQKTYSLEITPETNSTLTSGTLYVSIQANSFEDLSANQNDKPYSNSFTVLDSSTTIHTISFKLNGGSFISPQITNLKVVTNTAIEETKLGGILSYPPTGPKPSIQAVTRDIFEWRNTNGTKYDFSTPVSSDLTLEAVWSNSCGKVETFHPANKNELQNYVNPAVANSTTNLNHINTSAITDMYSLFYNKTSFNGKIDCWNTANVTNMDGMFNEARVFNQDISSWNVANVNNMWGMFKNAYAFNQDIGSWNVANLTTMHSMFYSAYAFNQDISSWNVANVTNMWGMFNYANAFDQDIGSWNVANVNNMEAMFWGASAFNQDIGSWNVANVNNMIRMFYVASAFNQDIGSWNVANVNNMNRMFYNVNSFNQDIGNWNVANVTNMSGMFYDASAFDQDLSKWSVSSLTNHDGMKWLVSSVNHDDMFTGSAMESKTSKHPKFSSNPKENIPPTVNISSDTLIEGESAYLSFTFSEKVSNFTPDDIQFLTNEANGVNAAKGSFVTNSLTTYSLEITPKKVGTLYVSIQANSFYDLSANQNDKPYSNSFTVFDSSTTTHTISFKLNGGSFISPQITNLRVVDNKAIEETRLGGILSYPPTGPQSNIQAVTRDIFEWRNTNGTKYDFSTPVSSDLTLEAVWSNSCGKIETFHPANRTQLTNYVNAALGANSTTNLNHIDISAIAEMNDLFNLKKSFNGKIGCWNTAKVNNMESMFSEANAFNQGIGSWDVANVNNMGGMFNNASAFNQDISSWDVSNVESMNYMFNNATAFNQNISSWNVANVINMGYMFAYATAFNQNISSWNVANVINMGYMFAYATAFNQDISSWNVANVNNMKGMFWGANAFNQDIGSWNVTKVTNMDGMFDTAKAFNGDISSWSVSNVTNMTYMFRNASAFNQDIGSWNVANVNNMSDMFYLAKVFNQDISSWNVSNVTDMSRMFNNASAFDQNLSSWSVSNVTSYDDMFTSSAMASKTNWYPKFK